MGGFTVCEGARVRFELIDRVVQSDAEHLVAVKAVSAAEEYLMDHFPGFPVLPGVMMLEAMVQAGRRFVETNDTAESDPGTDGAAPLVLTDVRNVRYSNMVRPGQCLTVKVTLRKHDRQGWEFAGEGTVGGKTAVQGRFRLDRLHAATTPRQN